MGVQEYLIEEGLQKGVRKGSEETARQIVLEMLKSEYPISEIARITKVTEAHVRELQTSLEKTV